MPTEKLQIFKCNICGNLIQVLLPGNGELVCCDQPMEYQVIQHDKSETGEKHAPVVEFNDNKKVVSVRNHPMIHEHYIQLIEIYKKDKSEFHLKYFHPEEEATFEINCLTDDFNAIEFCNIHRLWGENQND